MKQPVICTGALFYAANTNRFLFLLRAGTKYAGTWGTIGGKINFDESIIEGLKREITEEISFLPIITKYIPLESFTSHDQNFQYNTYICIVESEFIPTLNHENSGYAWAQIDTYPKPLHPGLYETLKVDEIKQKLKLIVSKTQPFYTRPAEVSIAE